jgi:hypothetical protein
MEGFRQMNITPIMRYVASFIEDLILDERNSVNCFAFDACMFNIWLL